MAYASPFGSWLIKYYSGVESYIFRRRFTVVRAIASFKHVFNSCFCEYWTFFLLFFIILLSRALFFFLNVQHFSFHSVCPNIRTVRQRDYPRVKMYEDFQTSRCRACRIADNFFPCFVIMTRFGYKLWPENLRPFPHFSLLYRLPVCLVLSQRTITGKFIIVRIFQ
jgi:hypothetical protein